MASSGIGGSEESLSDDAISGHRLQNSSARSSIAATLQRSTSSNYHWAVGWLQSSSKIYWSNKTNLYAREARILGHTPCPDGELHLSISPMTRNPSDVLENAYYAMGHKKGYALIINNRTYSDYSETRTGSHVDFLNMINLFRLLGYRTFDRLDLTAAEMLETVRSFAFKFDNPSAETVDSCVVVLMTHGMPGYFVGIDGCSIDVEQFFEPILSCKALEGKPKLYFIQACRAIRVNKIGKPVAMGMGGNVQDHIRKAELQAHQALISKLPTASDFCVFYSITPAYFSWRNYEKTGSWFIQALCEVFSAYAHEDWADLPQLSMKVRERMAQQFEAQKGILQMPHFELNNMTKKFHFFPGRSFDPSRLGVEEGLLKRLFRRLFARKYQN